MPNFFKFLSFPSTASGATIQSPAASWVYSNWATIVSRTTDTSFLQSINYQIVGIPSVDTTIEILFDIGIGSVGDEYVILQIPCSFRADTNAGFYMPPLQKLFLPEVMYIPPGSRLSVRVADSAGMNVTYSSIKLGFQNDIGPYPNLSNNLENYKNKIKGKDGLGVNVGR